MAPSTSLLEGTHTVLTPEYVEFTFPLAGLYSRFLAWAVDAVLALVLRMAVLVPLWVALGAVMSGVATALSSILWFVIGWGYSIAFETLWAGRTPGKRLFGLRVLQESGVRIGFWQAALRNILRLFDMLPSLYLVGGTAALFSRSQQRFGDLLAGTIVVKDRRLKIPASLSRPEGERHLLDDSLFQARVAKLSEAEEELIFQAALRREELSMDARLRLFSALSRRLCEERDFHKPENLSDEKLVLLVAAALVARAKKRAA